MKKTLINGLPGFGLPGHIGDDGPNGRNTIIGEYVENTENFNNTLMFEKYYGLQEIDRPGLTLHGKTVSDVRVGDYIIANVCGWKVFEVVSPEEDKTALVVSNEQKYQILTSMAKNISFSFYSALEDVSTSTNKKYNLLGYPTISTTDDRIDTVLFEIITEYDTDYPFDTHRMTIKPPTFESDGYVTLLKDIDGDKLKKIKVLVFALCKTNTTGIKKYFIGSDEISL